KTQILSANFYARLISETSIDSGVRGPSRARFPLPPQPSVPRPAGKEVPPSQMPTQPRCVSTLPATQTRKAGSLHLPSLRSTCLRQTHDPGVDEANSPVPPPPDMTSDTRLSAQKGVPSQCRAQIPV